MQETHFSEIIETIRCANDLTLFEKLLAESEVIQTNTWIEKEAKKSPTSIRRHLLTTSVRLTEKMSPDIHAMANDCIERLGVKIPLELYVYASPQFNAACFKPEQDRLYVMFSSSLLESFTSQELKYVMGHELGHHIYRHHEIPIGYLLKGKQKPSPKMTLELFAWSRYAEISADRAGAVCADDFNSVASALFKLSSGLGGSTINFELDDFLRQVDEMQVLDVDPKDNAPTGDWFSTHPFSPLRVKALDFFHQSELMNSDISKQELEIHVQSLMGLMEPSYLEGKTESAEAMRRLLFAGAIAVAAASGGISEAEKKVFEDFFGKGSFKEELNLEKLIASIGERADAVKKMTSHARRYQLLRDLIIIARADDRVTSKERKVLVDIAANIGLSSADVEAALSLEYELD